MMDAFPRWKATEMSSSSVRLSHANVRRRGGVALSYFTAWCTIAARASMSGATPVDALSPLLAAVKARCAAPRRGDTRGKERGLMQGVHRVPQRVAVGPTVTHGHSTARHGDLAATTPPAAPRQPQSSTQHPRPTPQHPAHSPLATQRKPQPLNRFHKSQSHPHLGVLSRAPQPHKERQTRSF
jgi:hypothetical protein